MIECFNCGSMIVANNDICEICESDLSLNHVDDYGEVEEECCENCKYYDASHKTIECPVLAKKWDREHIEIDCPDSMHCESWRKI